LNTQKHEGTGASFVSIFETDSVGKRTCLFYLKHRCAATVLIRFDRTRAAPAGWVWGGGRVPQSLVHWECS